MKEYNPDGLRKLANAIVERAAEDYVLAYTGHFVGGRYPEQVIQECTKFFHSSWYATLTDIDGDWLMEQLRTRGKVERKQYSRGIEKKGGKAYERDHLPSSDK